MKTSSFQSRFSARDSILSLLQHWEAPDRQILGDTGSFQLHTPEAQVLLREVSKRIESGRWHTTDWNIFEILGCVRREDSHSDTLAWLFKPWEAHGLGECFLRDFVRIGVKRSLPDTRVRTVETRKTIGIDGGKIDIEVQGDGWVLAVENKIDDAERPGQTECYAAHYRRVQEVGTDVFGVFLTLGL